MSEKDIHKDEDGFSRRDSLGAGDEKSKDAFGTPENYFESFSSRLFKKIETEDELKDYPLLLSIGKVNPFSVPQDYFEVREELLQYPSLRNLKTMKFTVPLNYFEKLPARIRNKIEVLEETKEYITLSSIGKQNAFAIPQNYFEEFAVQTTEKEARVISIFARVKTSYKVAMAASVAIIISLSIVLNEKDVIVPNNNNDCHTLACVSKKEILNSSYMQTVSEENIIEMIDVKDFSDSLSLKKNGKTRQINADEVSEEMDINTITDEL